MAGQLLVCLLVVNTCPFNRTKTCSWVVLSSSKSAKCHLAWQAIFYLYAFKLSKYYLQSIYSYHKISKCLFQLLKGKVLVWRAVELVAFPAYLHVFNCIKARLVTFRKGFICHSSTANRTFPSECFWNCMPIPSVLHLATETLPKPIALRFLSNASLLLPII